MKGEIIKRLGNKVRELRRVKGLSSDKLGELIGKDGSFIRRLEGGKIKNIPDEIEDIAKVLGVSVVELLGDMEENDEILISKLITRRVKNKKIDRKIYELAERRLKRALEDIDDLLRIV